MPRPRNPENTGLPARWRKRGRVYWYSVSADERDMWGGQSGASAQIVRERRRR